jgi:hypothetical protein
MKSHPASTARCCLVERAHLPRGQRPALVHTGAQGGGARRRRTPPTHDITVVLFVFEGTNTSQVEVAVRDSSSQTAVDQDFDILGLCPSS